MPASMSPEVQVCEVRMLLLLNIHAQSAQTTRRLAPELDADFFLYYAVADEDGVMRQIGD